MTWTEERTREITTFTEDDLVGIAKDILREMGVRPEQKCYEDKLDKILELLEIGLNLDGSYDLGLPVWRVYRDYDTTYQQEMERRKR